MSKTNQDIRIEDLANVTGGKKEDSSSFVPSPTGADRIGDINRQQRSRRDGGSRARS